MKNIISLLVSLLIGWGILLSGLVFYFNLAHPFWSTRATLIGAAIGIAITLLLFWLGSRKPSLNGPATSLLALLLVVSLAATWYFAKVFIDSADFEPLAARIWFLGYNASVALFVPVVATMLKRLTPAAIV